VTAAFFAEACQLHYAYASLLTFTW